MKVHNTDYPAAHSMDTSWYAVDDLGNIAEFHTGEGGAYPRGIGLEHACCLYDDGIVIEADLAAKKLPCIQYFQDMERNANIAGPYDRESIPFKPANVRDLSPEARVCLERARLPDTDFLEMPVVQPAEHVPCDAYENELDYVISRDRRTFTVLPRPHGLTPEFADWCRSQAERLGMELVLPDDASGNG